MADHNLPTNSSLYTDVLAIIDERLDDIAKGLDPVTATNMSNLPLYALRWSSTDKKWLKQTSSGTWSDLTDLFAINISGNAATVSNGVYTTGNQSIGGTKTFTSDVYVQSGTTERKIYLGSSSSYLYGNATYYGIYSSASSNISINLSNGTITSTGNITAYSDIRLKKDFIRITGALDKIEQLTGYIFTRIDNNLKQTGLIAQDVNKVLPEATTQMEDGYLGVAYGQLAGLFVEAIKELKQEIELLKNSIKQ